MYKPKVIVICGPTASGKTALSIELAKRINGEIISSDSMQIYKDMDIGTAKPTKEEMKEMYFSFLKGIRTDKTFVDDFWKQNQNKIKEWYLNQKRKDDVIISASPEFLLKPICDVLGIDNLIATKVELSSGKFLSKNCQGAEKVVRFKEIFPEAEIEAFYSDSKSDTYMAKLATKAFRVKKNSIMDWEQG